MHAGTCTHMYNKVFGLEQRHKYNILVKIKGFFSIIISLQLC